MLPSAPGAASFQARVYAFAHGTDNAISRRYSTDGLNYTAWVSLGGNSTSAPAGAAYTPSGGAWERWTMSVNWGATVAIWLVALLVLAAIIWGIRQLYRRFR